MQAVRKLNTQEMALPFPPKTAGFPLIGSIPNLVKKQVDYLVDAWREYGDIYTLDLGIMQIVVVNHPDYAQYVLRDAWRNYGKGGEMWDSIRTLIGDGLVTAEGEVWRRNRRMMQPHFHRQHLAGLSQLMLEAINDGMADWDALAESGESFDISKAFSKVTMKVITRTMFGSAMSAEEADKMGVELSFAVRYLMQLMVTDKVPKWIPVPGRKRYQEVLDYFNNFLYSVIERRRREPDQSGDLLAMMLNMVDEETGHQMTDKEIRDEAATIFAAGYETTSVAMSWAVHMLSQHPDIAYKLQESVDTTLNGAAPSFENFMQLVYPRMVMEETMRLYPPAYQYTRQAIEDDVMGGYRIKAGQMVFVVPLTIQRHPDFWEHPTKFDPQRFAPEAAVGRHPLAFMPFGAGQRQCIGKDFAMMEGIFILTKLAQRYHIHADPTHEAKPGLAATLSPKDGVWVRLEKR